MSDSAAEARRAKSASDSSRTTVCEVFLSPRREGLYLYVKREDGLDKVPAALLDHFGQPESALIFRLSAERPLAQANAADVLNALAEPGYYLQLPPGENNQDTGFNNTGASSNLRSGRNSDASSDASSNPTGGR